MHKLYAELYDYEIKGYEQSFVVEGGVARKIIGGLILF
jgi:hypothetical protein